MNDTFTYPLLALAAALGVSYAALGDIAVLQDLLIGVAVGALLGRLAVRNLERRTGTELAGRRVRQIEAAWIIFGAAAALSLYLILEVLL